MLFRFARTQLINGFKKPNKRKKISSEMKARFRNQKKFLSAALFHYKINFV